MEQDIVVGAGIVLGEDIVGEDIVEQDTVVGVGIVLGEVEDMGDIVVGEDMVVVGEIVVVHVTQTEEDTLLQEGEGESPSRRHPTGYYFLLPWRCLFFRKFIILTQRSEGTTQKNIPK